MIESRTYEYFEIFFCKDPSNVKEKSKLKFEKNAPLQIRVHR